MRSRDELLRGLRSLLYLRAIRPSYVFFLELPPMSSLYDLAREVIEPAAFHRCYETGKTLGFSGSRLNDGMRTIVRMVPHTGGSVRGPPRDRFPGDARRASPGRPSAPRLHSAGVGHLGSTRHLDRVEVDSPRCCDVRVKVAPQSWWTPTAFVAARCECSGALPRRKASGDGLFVVPGVLSLYSPAYFRRTSRNITPLSTHSICHWTSLASPRC